MATIDEIRAQYPQYSDLTDQQLADGLYQAHYSDMPRDQFDSKIGMSAINPPKEEPFADPMSGQILGYGPGPETPQHGGYIQDAAQFLSTAAAKAAGGLTDFVAGGPQGMIRNLLPGPFKDIANIENSTPKLPGVPAEPGRALTDAYYQSVIPEYKPQTDAGQIGMAVTSGAMAGAPFGILGGILGGLSGGAGGTAAELGAPDYVQALASVSPALLGKPGAALAKRMAPLPMRVARRLGSLMDSDAAVGAKDPAQIGTDLMQTDQPPWYAPKPLTLADVAGPAVQGEAERVAQLPQQSGSIARTALEGRAKGTASRMNADADVAMGNSDSAFNTTNALIANRKAAADPLYKAAYDEPGNQDIQSPTIDRILATPAGQQALGYARTRMQNRMEPLADADPDLTAQARETGQLPDASNNVRTPGVSKGLSLQTLQYVKESLDAMWRSSKSPMAPPELSSQSGELNNLRASLVSQLDKADATTQYFQSGPNKGQIKTPGQYAQARGIWSGDQSAIDAVDEGTQVFRKSPDQVQSEIGALDPGDQDMYRAGIKTAYKAMIGERGGTATANKLTKDDADFMRQKMSPAFANENDLDTFIKSADQESTMAATRNRLLGNSATNRRALQQHDAEGEGLAIPAGMAAAGLAHGDLLATLPLLKRGAATVQNFFHGNSPAFNAEMARQLFTMSPSANRAILARIAGAKQSMLSGSYAAPSILGGNAAQQSMLSGNAQ